MLSNELDPMKVAIITPYHNPRRDWLEKCHQSVLKQTYPCTHILVADGNPQEYVNQWKAQHIVLHTPHQDFGDTPRAVASVSAIGQGFDAIAYLDDDNWYHPQHIESLIKLHKKTKAPVCASNRLFTRIDGTPMGICPISHPDSFIDTSCYLFTKSAFQIATAWSFIPPQYHALDDRMILFFLKNNQYQIAFSNAITVAYRTKHPGDYAYFGETRKIDNSERAKFQRIGKARKQFYQETGIDLKVKRVRPAHKYCNGNFWNGSIAIES